MLEIISSNVSTTFITCPADPKKTLGIKLPFLVMIIKNLKKYFTFEVQVTIYCNVIALQDVTQAIGKEKSIFPCSVIVDFSYVAKRGKFALLRLHIAISMHARYVLQTTLQNSSNNPFMLLSIKVLDDKNVRRRFRASNYQSTTRVKPFICTMPMRLDVSSCIHKLKNYVKHLCKFLGRMEPDPVQPVRLYTSRLWNELRRDVASPDPCKLPNSPSLLLRSSLFRR